MKCKNCDERSSLHSEIFECDYCNYTERLDFNQYQFNLFENLKELFEYRMYKVAYKYANIIKFKLYGDFDYYEIENNEITVWFEESAHCSCCSPEHYCVTFPLDYLFNDDWIVVEEKKQSEKEEKREQEKVRLENEKQERQKQQDYDKYLELKKQFEE